MQSRLEILRNLNQPADMYLHLEAQRYLENLPNNMRHSIMESEFITLNKAGEEVEWLRQFLEDIPPWPKLVPAICIHCDNQAMLSKAQNFIYNGKSKHIRHRRNIVKQLLSNGIIFIDFVSSKDNLTDPLAKGLSGERIRGMGLKA